MELSFFILIFGLVEFIQVVQGIKVSSDGPQQGECPGENYLANRCKVGRLYIDCYDCDTRNNNECGDPTVDFKPPKMKLKPNTKECSGCCFMLLKDSANSLSDEDDDWAYLRRGGPEFWIKRGCSDDYQINYNFTGQCVKLGHGETMCFCDGNGCNAFNQTKSVCSGSWTFRDFGIMKTYGIINVFLASIFFLVCIFSSNFLN